MPDKGIDAPTWWRLMSWLLQKAMMAKDSTSARPQNGWKQVTAQTGMDVMTQVLKGALAGVAAKWRWRCGGQTLTPGTKLLENDGKWEPAPLGI